MATYYDVTLGMNIPHGTNILNRPCQVVFSYPDGSHSSHPYHGAVFAWRLQNVICMVSNVMNIEAGWNGANGGMLSIDTGPAGVLHYPITGFVNIGADHVIKTSHSFSRRNTMADYQVTINMDTETVTSLEQGNYNLFGFKAVQSTQGGGAPLVWFKTDNYSATTAIEWQVQYQAYTSNSQIIPNGQITASYATDIDLGQQLNVEAGGIGTVVTGGPSTAISVHNTTTTPFTCGISEMTGGTAKPLCAFPLYGTQLDVMAPIEKVLLMFATNAVNTGTVIERAYSRGVFIDLTNENQRTVDFKMNTAWSWGGGVWARQILPEAELAPILIEAPGQDLLTA